MQNQSKSGTVRNELRPGSTKVHRATFHLDIMFVDPGLEHQERIWCHIEDNRRRILRAHDHSLIPQLFDELTVAVECLWADAIAGQFALHGIGKTKEDAMDEAVLSPAFIAQLSQHRRRQSANHAHEG